MTDRLRVLLLIPHLGGGGAEQVTALLARGLPSRKFDIHLGLVTQQAGPIGALSPPVSVHALGATRIRYGAFRILRLVWRLRPNVILSGMAHLNFLVLLMRPLFPRRTVVIVRQNTTVSAAVATSALPWWTRWLYRTLYLFADRIVCQSRAMADDLRAVTGIAVKRLVVLPNPIDLERIRGGADPALWPSLGPNLLAIGRLAHEKGFDLLLRSFALIRRDFPHAGLVILGEGPEEPSLKQLAGELGLLDAVRFPGHVSAPWSFYAGASLFVLSSRHEGLPNALVEALAGDLPVVATPASGGVVDLLTGRPRAWLAHTASVDALYLAIHAALEELEADSSFDQRSQPYKAAHERLKSHNSLSKPTSRPIARSGEGPRERRYTEYAGEFEFERAFEAYEALIDAVAAETRP